MAAVAAALSVGGASARTSVLPAAVPAGTAATGVPLGVKSGTVRLAVGLSQPSLAKAAVAGHKSNAAQHAQLGRIRAQQATVTSQLKALGGKPLAHLTNALNAVVARVDRTRCRRSKRSRRQLGAHRPKLRPRPRPRRRDGAHIGAQGPRSRVCTVRRHGCGARYRHRLHARRPGRLRIGGRLREGLRDEPVRPAQHDDRSFGLPDHEGDRRLRLRRRALARTTVTTETPDPNPIDCSPSTSCPGAPAGTARTSPTSSPASRASPGTAPGAKMLIVQGLQHRVHRL